MDRHNRDLEGKEIQSTLAGIANKELGAIVFCGYGKYGKFDDDFIKSRVKHFSLETGPVKVGNCRIWYDSRL